MQWNADEGLCSGGKGHNTARHFNPASEAAHQKQKTATITLQATEASEVTGNQPSWKPVSSEHTHTPQMETNTTCRPEPRPKDKSEFQSQIFDRLPPYETTANGRKLTYGGTSVGPHWSLQLVSLGTNTSDRRAHWTKQSTLVSLDSIKVCNLKVIYCDNLKVEARKPVSWTNSCDTRTPFCSCGLWRHNHPVSGSALNALYSSSQYKG